MQYSVEHVEFRSHTDEKFWESEVFFTDIRTVIILVCCGDDWQTDARNNIMIIREKYFVKRLQYL
jgi:hypothetical protein